MLKYAVLQNGNLVSINDEKEGPYFCPECLAPIGRKKGTYRTWHFFHYEENSSSHRNCKKKGNCEHHELIQLTLQKQLQELFSTTVEIEYPIPQAQRIADLAIPDKKIAIEIQRSPLAFDRLLERTEAYWRHDWAVLWLIAAPLWQIDSMPRLLQKYGQVPHYMFEERAENVAIWDILLLKERKTLQRPLHSFLPKRRDAQKVADCLTKRKNWTLHIEGDFLDRLPEIQPQVQPTIFWKKSLQYLKLLWFRCISSGN